MTENPLSAFLALAPKWPIAFDKSYASLARPMNQPIFDDGNGLVIFGDSSAIYLAKVADPGQAAYPKLPKIKATTFIHGWSLDAGNLYVSDGVEVSLWNLGDGVKTHTLQLVDDTDLAAARAAMTELNKAIQTVEWATLLEQAEDEWIRLTAQQVAAPQPSDERDRLDALAADYFHMLTAMRKMVGSTGGGPAARQKISDLRKTLADKRKAAAPWCFSRPVVRKHALEESSCSVFTMQGNGTLHGCDKQLTPNTHKRRNWGRDKAELQIAFLDEETAAPKLVVYISDSTIYAVDAKSLDEKSHWAIPTPPTVNPTHSLDVANGQFWWSTDSGVYAFKPDDQSKLQLTWQTGAPWSVRQVGRPETPDTIYKPPIDPSALFETMNVHGWIAKRTDQSAPLTDGATAQLMLSDPNGSYVMPPHGTTHVLYGPFSRDASATNTWGEVKAHPRNPLVLLSDSNTTSMFCRYPTPAGLNQLLPTWAMSPSLSFVTKGSAVDNALAKPWPAPPVRPVAKPKPDMIDAVNKSAAAAALDHYVKGIWTLLIKGRKVGDRELRYMFWYVAFNRPFPNNMIMENDGRAKQIMDVFYNDAQRKALADHFTGLGTTWDFRLGTYDDTTYQASFMAVNPPVDFDPPYVWKSHPGQPLFHQAPPAWYDPWGYNRPGDFITDPQPASTYLDPFCFNGHLKFPQRPVTLETGFKGRQWAVFTDANSTSSQPVSTDILTVRTDDDRQQTSFFVLPSKRLIVTYDAASHELHPEELPYGFANEHVLGCPAVFFDAAKTFPAGWCAGSKEYPSVRLRKIALVDQSKGKSIWDTFVDQNKTQYGPSGGDTAWKIDQCPLPSDVLPALFLYGYLLPAPH